MLELGDGPRGKGNRDMQFVAMDAETIRHHLRTAPRNCRVHRVFDWITGGGGDGGGGGPANKLQAKSRDGTNGRSDGLATPNNFNVFVLSHQIGGPENKSLTRTQSLAGERGMEIEGSCHYINSDKRRVFFKMDV